MRFSSGASRYNTSKKRCSMMLSSCSRATDKALMETSAGSQLDDRLALQVGREAGTG